jgi:antitoxin CptB
MNDELELRRRRAAYRASHRGTKEMDLILGRFADVFLEGICAEKMTGFERLIALPDPVLTQWFSQDETPSEPEFAQLIAAMRAFHGLGKSPAGMTEESE